MSVFVDFNIPVTTRIDNSNPFLPSEHAVPVLGYTAHTSVIRRTGPAPAWPAPATGPAPAWPSLQLEETEVKAEEEEADLVITTQPPREDSLSPQGRGLFSLWKERY